MTVTALGQLAGGLGLFLIALGMMTDGLKLAAGRRLKTILQWGTTPAWRGLASGILITALVQASGAVTVTTIGFVNAGLMTLSQSLAVIFGTNIGTTVTGWLVAVVGFDFDIAAFALPMVGLGMIARLAGGGRAWGSLGWALAGFGLFFLGLDILKDGFEGLSSGTPVGFVSERGFVGVLLSLAVGIVVTVLAQSSSAAVALVLTAAQSGLVLLPSAAAMVIGANIGTTSTAVIATIGATANAKRVAWAHVLFNVVTGAVALLLLAAAQPLGLLDHMDEGLPAATFLALFHTAFNLLGVALTWPMRHRMADFLAARFRSADEDLARPAFLDPTVAGIPALGGMALLNETARIGGLTLDAVTIALRDGGPSSPAFGGRHDAALKLVFEAAHYAARVQEGVMSPGQSRALADTLRVCQYYAEAVDIAQRLKGLGERLQQANEAAGLEPPEVFVADWLAVVGAAVPAGPLNTGPGPDQGEVDGIETRYHALRQGMIDATVQGRLNPEELSGCLEDLAEMNRLMKRMVKAGRLYRGVAPAFADGPLPPAPDAGVE